VHASSSIHSRPVSCTRADSEAQFDVISVLAPPLVGGQSVVGCTPSLALTRVV